MVSKVAPRDEESTSTSNLPGARNYHKETSEKSQLALLCFASAVVMFQMVANCTDVGINLGIRNAKNIADLGFGTDANGDVGNDNFGTTENYDDLVEGFFGDGRKLLQINGIACKLEGEYAWALSAGTMSLGISGIALLLGILAPPAYEIIAAPLAVLLFLIWIPGTLVTTFLGTISIDSPNGYYAAWAAFVLSFNFMAARLSKTKRPNVKYTAQQPRSRKKTSHLKKQEETSDDDDYDDV